MIPAPMKPIPTTMLAIIFKKPPFLEIISLMFSGLVPIIYGRERPIIVKIAAPAETSIEVLMPASLPANSLSRPIKIPRARAITRWVSICSKVNIAIQFYYNDKIMPIMRMYANTAN